MKVTELSGSWTLRGLDNELLRDSCPALMREDIELQVLGRAPVYEYGRSGGILVDDESTQAAIMKIIEGGEQ